MLKYTYAMTTGDDVSEDLMHKKFEVTKAKAYPLGVHFQEEGMHIAAVCMPTAREGISPEEFGVILYDRRHKDGLKIPFPEESRIGAVYAMLLKGYHDETCQYLFYCGERKWQDPYCRKIENLHHYGVPKKAIPRCMVQTEIYDWGEDRMPGLPYEEMILYALHVRGFTRHRSSGVKHKGTYDGIVEKIPYLRELGITSVLLMPTYEFDEIMDDGTVSEPATMEQAAASYKQPPAQTVNGESESVYKPSCRLNYWGYQSGLYYIPKSNYAYGNDAVTEYKNMVRELHSNGIEVLMQFYFPPEISQIEMLEILKYWVVEYHIDGFHVMGVDLPISLFAKEPFLSETKLLSIQQYQPTAADYMATTRRLGWMNEGFLYDMRRVVKGDDNMINQLIYHVRNNRQETGIVNYIAKWEGMRLMDMVTYDRKHNELNGEDNQDGTDYNCSWNCGVEGKSRRKNIEQLRLRQMQNALTFVFLSQGTPLLYSGDEFGNTQDGNNNPYCQDNAIAWIKWNQTEIGRKLSEYTKMLIRLRKAHPILHGREPLTGMDLLSCGYPDISFHGREAWRPDTSPASRSLGIMYCRYYEKIDGCQDDTFLYIGINMHWHGQYLGLPKLPKGKVWTLYSSTDAKEYPGSEDSEEDTGTMQEIYVGPRTIVIYAARECPEETVKKRKNKRD